MVTQHSYILNYVNEKKKLIFDENYLITWIHDLDLRRHL